MKFGRKADGGLVAIIIILIVVIVLGVLINLGNRECTKDSHCKENYYCGSDFKCHPHPVIEKRVFQNSLIVPSVIIGIAIIIAAYLLRNSRQNSMRKKPEQEHSIHSPSDTHSQNEMNAKHSSPHSTRVK